MIRGGAFALCSSSWRGGVLWRPSYGTVNPVWENSGLFTRQSQNKVYSFIFASNILATQVIGDNFRLPGDAASSDRAY